MEKSKKVYIGGFMKTIINNIHNLKDNEITDLVKKVKILLINSKNEIMLGYADHEYQFPGGTGEPNEELVETVNREIEEETGIFLNIKQIDPFLCAIGYYKDWPKEGRNKKIEIYYYEVKTDKLPNLDNLNLTESEKEKNFELRYINLDTVEDEIKKNVDVYGDPHGITKEMLQAFNVYKNN
jgi:8-oxo-dGTP pyrophosphatase MutT (NUDIX family)